MHSPHQGICGQTSSWRLVPLKNSSNSKTNTNTPKATSSHNYNAKLPACTSRNREGTLLEGENITMNKIEEFLETREHIDKTEFDMVVRNLLEETSDVGSSGRIQTPKSSNTSSINSNCSFPKFNSSGSHHQNNRMVHTENRFVAAPYHPEQSKFYGKNRFFEPAAYVHLPNVSSKTSNSKKGPENRVLQNLKAEDRRDSSFSSVESEKKGQATASTHEFVENEIIGTDFLMETFNNSQSGESESHAKIKSPSTNLNNPPSKTSSTNLQPSSVKGLPPLGSCSLVTRTNIGQSQQKRHSLPSTEIVESLEGHSSAGSKRRHSLQEPACPHETRTEDCRRGKRPPSRGGRIIKDWLQRKTSL
ncbi:uncharacterized protein [Clytia hemisphaerica]|uniref:Uncharacterized protein n=1 Tax=Clytia hemisphaerica TaxID=252671 RepID=A0A7M5WIV0_9CNID